MANTRRCIPLIFVVLLAGCGTNSLGPDPAPLAGCPAGGWDAAVIWSTESAPASRLDYVSGDQVVATDPLAYQGLAAAPTPAPFRHGGDAWLVSNGNTTRDATHLLRWSQKDCSAHAYPVPEQVIWTVVAADDAFYTTNTVNGAAHVVRRGMDGEVEAEATFDWTVLSSLTLADGRLYAAGTTGDPGREESVLLTLDPTNVTEIARVSLGPAGLPLSTAARDGQLYLPTATASSAGGTDEHEVSTVPVVDLATNTVHSVELGAKAPYLVADAGEHGLVFAHTFMNEGFRPLDDYRTVTLFHPESGATDTLDVGPGLRQVAVAGDELLVLTQTNFANARLARYSLPGLQEVSSVDIEPPGEEGHYYLSGMIAHLP